ncbi:hypothetical protein ScPMuIL_011112 [Solemya velum]
MGQEIFNHLGPEQFAPNVKHFGLATFAPNLNHLGLATLAPNVNHLGLATFAPNLNHLGLATFTPNLNKLGLATFALNLNHLCLTTFAPNLNHLGIATFASNLDHMGLEQFGPNFNHLGLSSFSSNFNYIGVKKLRFKHQPLITIKKERNIFLMAYTDIIPQWHCLPDDIVIQVFFYLPAPDLLNAGVACRRWLRISYDDLLWKDLFHHHWKVKFSVPLPDGKASWLQEYRRLHYCSPQKESEIITKHKDQVLHVNFSHNGKMFATCSKDGFIMVWNASYPVTLKHKSDMKQFSWKYTQYSQFNASDSLLLVSGVHFGTMSTSGEIAVFNLRDNFRLESRVINKPYDVFGTWYNESHLLSGNLHWTGQLQSCSTLSLNYAYQENESPNESVVMRLYRFHNFNASSIRTIMIADRCLPKQKTCSKESIMDESGGENNSVSSSSDSSATFSDERCKKAENKTSKSVTLSSRTKCECVPKCDHCRLCNHGSENKQDILVPSQNSFSNGQFTNSFNKICVKEKSDRTLQNPLFSEVGDSQDITVNSGSSKESSLENHNSYDLNPECKQHSKMSEPFSHSHSHDSLYSATSSSGEKLSEELSDKYLIFTMGSETYTPHQVGIKLIRSLAGAQSVQTEQSAEGLRLLPEVEDNNHGLDRDDYDSVDHLIDLHGHIIGMCLSPDHRYLYVNSRPWPQNYFIESPLSPPPIAQEIDIHVIDLVTMKEVGTMHQSHKAYTPNDECFFIFLDVSDEFVASGAEDRHGYLWDRHYGVCLSTFPHNDVVNSVAFNPKDSETMVTVSDDFSIKIWRSKRREKEVKTTYKERVFRKVKPPKKPI